MKPRRKAIAAMSLAVVVCAVIAVLVFLFYMHATSTTSEELAVDTTPQRDVTHHPGNVATADGVQDDGIVVPEGYPEAHAAIAEAMGYTAMVCWVGHDWDGEVVVNGSYNMRIQDGWYSDVETSLYGRKAVDLPRSVPCPDTGKSWFGCGVEYERLFYVSWKAEEPGQVATCTVEYATYGELRIDVRDQHGELVDGVRVAGCGSEGRAVNGKKAVLADVNAGDRCPLLASCFGGKLCADLIYLSPPLRENEIRELTLDVVVVDGPESRRLSFERSKSIDVGADERAPSLQRSFEDELVVLREMALSEVNSEALSELVEDLIRHREWVLDTRNKRDDRMDDRMSELDLLFEDMGNASSSEERIELAGSIQEVTDEIINDL
jgi:hypothetical protein